MEILSKVSKGSRMDQIYLPKQRHGLPVGTPVTVRPLEAARAAVAPVFYRVRHLEPVKVRIIEDLFAHVQHTVPADNVIVSGSVLEPGFQFNDLDVLVVSDEPISGALLTRELEDATGVKIHLLTLSRQALQEGLATDPFYAMLLGRCVAAKRFLFRIRRRCNFRLLDLHLLRSEPLLHGFDLLDGPAKYAHTRNLAAIALFVDGRPVHPDATDRTIKARLGVESQDLKRNMVDKATFLRAYRQLYAKTQKAILEGAARDAKPKKAP